MRLRHFLTLLLALCAAPFAQADIFKCVDAEGRTTYTNDRNAGRSCQRIQQETTSFGAPPAGTRPAAAAPAAAPATATTTSPSGFPRISQNDQRTRDDTRRKVLEQELASEEAALAAARAQLAEQEGVRHGNERNYQKVLERLQPFQSRVELHTRNIEALRKEMRTLR
jgi:hypothetical protein